MSEFAWGPGARLLVIALAALALTWLLRRAAGRLVRSSVAGPAGRVARLREQQMSALAARLFGLGTTVILAIAVLAALPEFGFNLTPAATVAGLALLTAGLCAHRLVRDLIGGFLIVFEDQYAVGDTVRVGNLVGRVEALTLRRTLLRDARGALVSIPNGAVGTVGNLSRDWGQLFLDTTVAADQPLAEALAALEAVAGSLRADALWSPTLVDGPRVLGVEALGANGITLRMQVRTTPNRQDDVGRELRRRIQLEFEQRGVRLGDTARSGVEIGPAESQIVEP